MEARSGAYQELAKGFGVRDYTFLYASTKANEVRFKTGSEFKKSHLSGMGFSGSLTRHVLFAVHETVHSEDAREGLKWFHAELDDYWNQRKFILEILKYYGRIQYPNSTSILILADGGGSNSSRHCIFKEDLRKLVDEIGVEIRMAHSPPYTSKWNPIEHRLFSHITRSLKGVILKSHNYVKELIENTTTLTGLKIKAHIIKKIYKTGRKYADNFKKTMRIVFDDYLGQWNYRAIPGKV